MVSRRNDPIDNFLDDVTTALPYSDYIRDNIGKYIIIDNKPYLVKGIKFRHTVEHTTNNRVIQAFIGVENTRDDVYLAIFIDLDLIYAAMDNPMIIIDLVNSHLGQKLKFLPKNKVTDLLFKNEG